MCFMITTKIFRLIAGILFTDPSKKSCCIFRRSSVRVIVVIFLRRVWYPIRRVILHVLVSSRVLLTAPSDFALGWRIRLAVNGAQGTSHRGLSFGAVRRNSRPARFSQIFSFAISVVEDVAVLPLQRRCNVCTGPSSKSSSVPCRRPFCSSIH